MAWGNSESEHTEIDNRRIRLSDRKAGQCECEVNMRILNGKRI